MKTSPADSLEFFMQPPAWHISTGSTHTCWHALTMLPMGFTGTKDSFGSDASAALTCWIRARVWNVLSLH